MSLVGSIAGLLLVGLFLLPLQAFAQAQCEAGQSCNCTAGVSCTCTDQCSFECQGGICDFTSPGGARLDCELGTTCTFALDRTSSLVCFANATCTGTVSGAGNITCRNDSTCSVTVGSGSTVACSPDSGDLCEVTCTADCAVNCMASGGTCVVTCAGGASPLQCGTTSVCGGACPQDGGVGPLDAGTASVDGGTDAGTGPDGGTSADGGVSPLRRDSWRLGVGCAAAPDPGLLGALAAVGVLLRRRQPRPA